MLTVDRVGYLLFFSSIGGFCITSVDPPFKESTDHGPIRVVIDPLNYPGGAEEYAGCTP